MNSNIVVIDLGWGGLLTAYEIYYRNTCAPTDNVNIIFLISPIFEYGMTREEKICTLNEYLYRVQRTFVPSSIVLACNSLSSIYYYTEFAKGDFKIVNVVDVNCEWLLNGIRNTEIVVLFGSNMTISEKAYSKFFIQKNLNDKSIVSIAIPTLAQKIEKNMYDERINELIQDCISKKLMPFKNQMIKVVLGCTHYEYIKKNFEIGFYKLGYRNIHFIDTNRLIAEKINRGIVINKKKFAIISYKTKPDYKTYSNIISYFDDELIQGAFNNIVDFNDFDENFEF